MLVRELSDEDDSTRGSLFDDEGSHADIEKDRATKPRTVLTLAPLLGAASSPWPMMWVGCGTLVIPIATIPSAAEHAAATDEPPPSPGDLVSIKFVVGRGNSAVAASDPTSVFPVVVDLASLVHSIEPAPSVDNTALLQRISRHHAEVEATWKWCPSSHSSSTTHSRRSMWRLVSLVVCDCRSLFGTCCNSVRLVPAVRTCIDVDTSVQDGQAITASGVRRHSWHIDFDKKVEPLTVVPDTISAVPVSATAVVDAWAQTEVDELPPLTKGSRQSGKKQPASAAQQKEPRQRDRSSNSSYVNINSVEKKPNKVIIVDDEESAPQELLPHPHGDATSASRTNASTNNADDTSVSILETQLGGRRERLSTNGAPVFVGDLVGPSMSTCTVPADHSSRPLTIVTTGTRLTAEERKACEKVSLTVNPPMTLFHSATYLVMEPPQHASQFDY
ncbi:Hypothetical protein, putative [Bodo saltans]|uniref:Uncharacterized protein n=1 Tax=Bodo saltans TaxID=75058 RepID=A0A0S4KJ44_BODSA|nr:Hypothetical protein, putative [Bodo saltans]|eukprot:CUI14555.1 Hypothetical protein, putative [Bodo saltans]